VLIYIYIYIYIETAILNITLKYIAEGKGNSEPHSLRLLLVGVLVYRLWVRLVGTVCAVR
jgi:hypothetical protein